MKTFLLSFLLLASSAFADTSVGTVTYGSVPLKRNATTVATINPATQQACTDRAQIDAESRDATTAYTCGNFAFTITWTAAPIVCPTNPPASTSRQTVCPSPLFGTYGQTQGWTLHATPTCWVNDAGWVDTPPSQSTCTTTPPSGTFSTSFDGTESPLSEAGKWARANNVWTNMQKFNSVAFGTNIGNNAYDDSYAILQGAYGTNYSVEAVAVVDITQAKGDTHEVELFVRMTDDQGNARGYECDFAQYGGNAIVRWGGTTGNFLVLSNTANGRADIALKTGDVLKCAINGNTISQLVNGVLVYRSTDSTFTTGNPGVGAFIRPGGSNRFFGLTSLTVSPN